MRSALLLTLASLTLVGTVSTAGADAPGSVPPPATAATGNSASGPGSDWDEGGWYAGEGFGSTSIAGEASRYFRGDSLAFRAFVGRRSHRWAIDAYIEAALLDGVGPLGDRGDYSAGTYGISGRYLFPVSDHVTTYLRGGLSRMMIHGNTVWGDGYGDASDRYSGRAVDYGVGIQLQGKVRALGLLYWPLFFTKLGPKVSASLWLDVTNRFARLHHPVGPTLDAHTRTWTFGFAVGGGF